MLNVKDFGAVGDGVADDSTPVQNAINSLPAGSGQVYLPTGTYKVTRTITIAQDRIKLKGDGVFATTILFAPTQDNQTCLKYNKAGNLPLIDAGGEDFTVFSNDGNFRKTAIELVVCLQAKFLNVTVKGSIPVDNVLMWTNHAAAVNPDTSIGWYVRGWEAGSFINCSSFADSPLRIGVNPNDPNISIDHYHWQNWYSSANENYNVEIESGVHLFNVTFDGYQGWVSGLGGLRWLDTTSNAASQMLRIENVRAAQFKDPAGWIVYIDHHSALYGLQINNSIGGIGEAHDGSFLTHNGIFTRNVVNADVQSFNFTATGAKTIYDTVGTAGHRLNFRDITCQSGQLASLVGMRLQHGSWSPATLQPIPANAVYTYDAPTSSPQGWPRLGPTGRESTFKGTGLANGASVNLQCGTATGINYTSFRVVGRGATKSEGGSCFLTTGGMFREGGTANFDAVDVAGRLCLYKSSGNVILKNNLGEAVDWFVFVVGSA